MKKHFSLFTRRRYSSKRTDYWLFASFLLFFSVAVFGQQHQITGRITDKEQKPIPGVNISIKSTTQGTVTDLDGKFVLSTDKDSLAIVISAVGFLEEEFFVTGSQVVNLTLIEDIKALDEVVVIGYGSQKTSLVTGAIGSLGTEDLEGSSASRVEYAMQGKAAGVFILPESGSPGAGMNVRIRGTGTNGNSNPLYIVDGIRMGDVNDIAPSDIESIEVLKDAASSAIYGAEGGNGVIIITTKSGSKQDGKVNYSFYYGSQSVGKLPSLLNAAQYDQYQSERGYTTISSSYDTDWLNELFEIAPMSSHNLSFSGDSDKTSYFSSISYFDQDGIIGGNRANFNRFTGRINVNHKVKKWLKVGANVNYARSKRTSLSEDDEFGGLIATALKIDPYTPTHYDADNVTTGMQDLIDAGNPVRMDSDGRYFAISENIQGEMINPMLQMDLSTGNKITDRVIGVFPIEITPFNGLTITSRPGVDFSQSSDHYWTPLYYYSNERNNSSLNVNDNIDKYYQWQWENFVSYAKQFGDHNISAVLGMSAQESKDKYLNTNTGVMVREGDKYAEHDFTSDNTGTISGNEYPNRLVSYFGRLGYDYKGRYMVQATLRNDITSTTNVPEDGISGVFPSVSAGWTISEEGFFNKAFINRVKLRGSWGQNGSIRSITSLARDEGQFLYTSTITSEGLRYPNSNGGFIVPAEPGVLPNNRLTWETSEQTNVGLDLGFWENRINLTADYYVKQTKDLLMRGQFPSTGGTSDPMINAGDVKNSGFEFSLGLRNNDNALKYGLAFNFATLKNEVTKLNLPTARVNGTSIGTGSWVGATAFEVGQPIWYFRGYETSGIDPETGNPIFVDHDGVEGITEADKTYLGDPHPDIMYGASLSLEYMGLDLNVFLQGQAGNQIVYGWMRTDRLTSNMHTDFYNGRWTPDNINASMPAAGADSRMFSSDLMVKDGAYTRIKQIQLGYTLPNSLLETIKVSNLRVYISLDDYFTFTKYGGMDPEAGSQNNNSQGIDRGVYPAPKKLMFGLSVSF